MQIVTPFPNTLYPLDLIEPADPVKWTCRAPQRTAAQGVACCEVVNRGETYNNGRPIRSARPAES